MSFFFLSAFSLFLTFSVYVCVCVHIVWECMTVAMCMPREVHRVQRTLCMVLTFHVVWDTVFCCFLWPCGSPYPILLQGCWDYSPCLALFWGNLNTGSYTFLPNSPYTELSPQVNFHILTSSPLVPPLLPDLQFSFVFKSESSLLPSMRIFKIQCMLLIIPICSFLFTILVTAMPAERLLSNLLTYFLSIPQT